MRTWSIVRNLSGLLVLLVTMSGCTGRSERSSSTPPPPAETLPDTAVTRPAVTPLHELWGGIVAQRETLLTRIEAQQWPGVKEGASQLRDRVSVYANRFDQATPMVASQMDALSEAMGDATRELHGASDRQDLAAARRQGERIQSILKQIATLARES